MLMSGFVSPGEVGLAQRERVLTISRTVFSDLLLTYWDDSLGEAVISKDDVRGSMFALLRDTVPVRELVELMLEQVAEDYSVFGWDIEENDRVFVFRPGVKE